MKINSLWSVLLFALIVFAAQKVSAEPVLAGKVKTCNGNVTVEREGQKFPLSCGDLIYRNDGIRTGRNSYAGIIFEDNSVLSLGPASEIVVDDFVFTPEKGLMGMVIRILKGTMSCISGIIGTQNPESVKFLTPDATIGIRGTHFLVKVK